MIDHWVEQMTISKFREEEIREKAELNRLIKESRKRQNRKTVKAVTFHYPIILKFARLAKAIGTNLEKKYA